jgi:hypothetical protein
LPARTRGGLEELVKGSRILEPHVHSRRSNLGPRGDAPWEYYCRVPERAEANANIRLSRAPV